MLYIAEQRHSPPASTGVVADLVDRSQAMATQMVQDLEAHESETMEMAEPTDLTVAGRVTELLPYESAPGDD